MHRGRAGAVVLFILLLSLAAPTAGAKTRSIDCTGTPGLLIDKAGTYTIQTAVNNCESDVLVQISASDVTLSLGGRMLDGSSTCLEGIHVDPDLKRIVIRNGAISGCDVGIRSDAHGPTVSNVVSFENDLGLDVKVGRFVKNVVAHSAGTGMTDDSGGTYLGNTIVSSGARGIDSLGATLIQKNRVIDAGGTGIGGGSGGRIVGNAVYGNTGDGIFLEDGKIERNTAIGNDDHGIETLGQPTITGNRALANTDSGIYTAEADARMTENVSRANASHGLEVASSADAIENEASGNLAAGMLAGDDAKIKQNVANGNVGFGIDAGLAPVGLGTNRASRNNNLATQCDPAALCVLDADSPDVTFFLSCTSTFNITQPGTYFLGASVLNCGGGTAINIQSSDVTLDLQGNRIDGTLAFAIGVNVVSGLTDVVVRNGTVSDYLLGFAAGDSTAAIEDVVAVDNFAAGVAIGEGATAEGNTVVRTSSSGAGIIMNPGSTAIGNTVVANDAQGILADLGPVTIEDNYIAGNGDAGIAYQSNPANGSTITGNDLIGNGWVAVRVGNDNTISGNVIKGSIDYPIEAGSGNTIKRNRITGNTGGISVDANNLITDNTVNGNLGSGIEAQGGSTIARNRVIGNTGDGIVTSGAAVVKRNTAIGNREQGIDAAAGSTGSGNVAKHNGEPDQCVPDGLGC